MASQTMDAMAVTGAVTALPIFRPLVGMDKEEAVRIARKIGTFETSILPYEDCCTVFTPRHPRTRPRLEDVEAIRGPLDMEGLVKRPWRASSGSGGRLRKICGKPGRRKRICLISRNSSPWAPNCSSAISPIQTPR
ncbi:MAG: hypothetical protein ACLSAF_06295 [Intestinimonas sp.]